MRPFLPCFMVSTKMTGVLKLVTFNRRCKLSGTLVLMKSTTMVLPFCLILMPAEASDRSTMMRPSPFFPRAKSTFLRENCC